VTLNFSEIVTGLDITDLTLTRDGTAVTLPAGSLLGSGSSYTLDLSSVTTAAGSYILTLKASGSGVIDSAGSAILPTPVWNSASGTDAKSQAAQYQS
jgi:hypothetical protein